VLQAGRSCVRFPMWSLRFFIDLPSVHTMALGLTRPVTEMSIRYRPWEVKVVQDVGMTTLPLSCANRVKTVGVVTCWSPSCLFRLVQG
jgi:hypothetical protein